jgi:hypothetical protein
LFRAKKPKIGGYISLATSSFFGKMPLMQMRDARRLQMKSFSHQVTTVAHRQCIRRLRRGGFVF